MKIYYILFMLAIGASPAFAQHIHTDTTKQHPMDMGDMDMGGSQPMMMHSQYSLDLPMNRDGSGTSWVPEETPIYAYMIHSKKWMTMIHGSFFMRHNNQDVFKSGTKGGSKFDVPNWLMAMTSARLAKTACSLSAPCFRSILFWLAARVTLYYIKPAKLTRAASWLTANTRMICLRN